MAGRITDEERDHIRALHAQGLSRNRIAREVGRSMTAVTTVCETLGLSFDRTRTKNATAAAALDIAERRERLRARLIGRAEYLMDAVEAGRWRTLTKTTGGAEQEAELPFVPVRDERDAAWSIGTYLANEERLAKAGGDAKTDTAKSVIEALFDGLRTVHDEDAAVPAPREALPE